MKNKKPRIGILTSGGDVPGLNAAIRVATGWAIGNGCDVVGIRRGFRGLLDGETLPLTIDGVHEIGRLGGTMLMSARFPEMKKHPEVVDRIARQLDGLGLDGLIVLGGNGSLRGAWELARVARTPIIGIPKTIDNDCGGTDTAIGFDSAVNVGVAMIDRIRDTARAMERFIACRVMGRDHGYLAAAIALASCADLVLVPEVGVSVGQASEVLIRHAAAGRKSGIVVVAEGFPARIDLLAEELTRLTGRPVAYDALGYAQRGGQPSAFDSLLASELGKHAVEGLLTGARGQIVGRVNGKITLSDLALAWQKRPAFPLEWLSVMECLHGLDYGAYFGEQEVKIEDGPKRDCLRLSRAGVSV